MVEPLDFWFPQPIGKRARTATSRIDVEADPHTAVRGRDAARA
jgi:hypothetical protein